jgi:hypothetical protein
MKDSSEYIEYAVADSREAVFLQPAVEPRANNSLSKKQLVMKCYKGPRVGSCEQGNEPSGSIKGEEFLDLLSDYQLLKKDAAPRS